MSLLLYIEFGIKIQRVSLIQEVTEQFKEIITKERSGTSMQVMSNQP